MSTDIEHLALANRNQATLEHLLLDEARCSEWIAAVAFYKSLHVVEAIFARESPPFHVHNHHVRLERLKSKRAYSTFYSHFRAMWSAALVARYLAYQPAPTTTQTYACFDDYLPAADIRPKLLDNYLYQFEHLAVQLLGPAGTQLVRYSRTAPSTAVAAPP